MEEEDGGVGLQELESQDVIELPTVRNSRNVDGVLVPIGATEGGRKASVHILSDDLINTPIDQVLGILQAEWAKIHIFIKLAVRGHISASKLVTDRLYGPSLHAIPA